MVGALLHIVRDKKCKTSTGSCKSRGNLFNKDALADPSLVSRFEHTLWSFRPSVNADVDAHVSEFKAFMKKSARRIFGPAARKPLKPWTSANTWLFLQHIGPTRRVMHGCRHQVRKSLLSMCVCAWASTILETFPLRTSNITHGFGWAALARAEASSASMRSWRWCEAVAYRCIALLQYAMRHLINDDRRQHHTKLAVSAQSASYHGDLRGTYKIVKKLAGAGLRVPKAVRLEDGTISTDKESRCRRWQLHFKNVVGGTLVSDVCQLVSFPTATASGSFFFSPSMCAVPFHR